MSLEPEPRVMHQPLARLYDDLDAYVDRYLARYPGELWLREEVVDVPCDAAGWLLRAHTLGSWDLEPGEVRDLWCIGRAMGGRREELLADEVLADALPGRSERPADPPGRWVQSLLLTGGAHKGGHGAPGKSEFPAHWDDDDTMDRCLDVARHPSAAVSLPSGDLRATGDRAGVTIGAVVSPSGELLTAYPVRGEGVTCNPLEERQAQAVGVLLALLDTLPLALGQEPRTSFDELVSVGEWPYVLESLMALDADWTHQQRVDLAELHEVSGLEIPPCLNRSG